MLVNAIVAVVFFLLGYVVSFFVMRNNPKYFNINKMAKDKLIELKNEIEGKIKGKF